MSILGMLDMDYEKLTNFKGDKIMDKLKNEALKLNNNDDFVKYLSDEDEERLLKNSFIEQGIEQGRKEGREEGRNESTQNIINKLISKGLSDKDIGNLLDISPKQLTKFKKVA